MGSIYMISKCCFPTQQIQGNALSEIEDQEVESIILRNTKGKSIFHHMRHVYQFLDYWKAVHSDRALLLVVDSETAKIVNSYFFDVNSKEYEQFSVENGNVYKYLY